MRKARESVKAWQYQYFSTKQFLFLLSPLLLFTLISSVDTTFRASHQPSFCYEAVDGSPASAAASQHSTGRSVPLQQRPLHSLLTTLISSFTSTPHRPCSRKLFRRCTRSWLPPAVSETEHQPDLTFTRPSIPYTRQTASRRHVRLGQHSGKASHG